MLSLVFLLWGQNVKYRMYRHVLLDILLAIVGGLHMA